MVPQLIGLLKPTTHRVERTHVHCWHAVTHVCDLSQVPTAGLLNIIGAPHLATDSTHTATYSSSNTAEQMRLPLLQQQPAAALGSIIMPGSQAVVQQAVDTLTAAGYPPRPIDPADYWSSGWPRLNPEPKLTDTSEDAGLQLPL